MLDYLQMSILSSFYYHHLSKMRLFLVVWVLALVFGDKLKAQSDLAEMEVSYVIGQNLSIEKIRNLASENFIKLAKGEVLNLGFLKQAVWVKVVVKKNTPNLNWVLNITMPYVDTLDFYYQKDTIYHQIQTGFHRPFASRKNDYSTFVFPVELRHKEEIYYFRVASSNPVILPINLYGQEEFYSFQTERILISGLFFGILIGLAFYNLLIFLSLKEVSYGYNGLSMIALILVMGTAEGHTYKYLWRNYPQVNIYSLSISMVLLSIFSSMTVRTFLDTKRYSIWLDRLLLTFVWVGIVVGVITAFTKTSFYPNQYLTITTPFYLISGILCWVKGNQSARFFIAAWFFYILGGVLVTLRNIGVLPYTFWTTYTSQIGSALEAIMLSFALSDRYSHIKKEKEQVMKKLLESEIKNSIELEEKVKQRTAELNELNSELQQLIEKLNDTITLSENQKVALEKNHKKIISSVNYAKRIQYALLPEENTLKAQLGRYFILNMPKDILSGDFYFVAHSFGFKFLILGDCTGHGIPGALLSIIGLTQLNEIIKTTQNSSPEFISNELDKRIAQMLFEKNRLTDSIETAVIKIDSANRHIEYSLKGIYGFICQNNQIYELERKRSSIGLSHKYTQKSFSYQQGAYLYLSSDGILDQFGGKPNQKFGKKRLTQLLSEIACFDIENQGDFIQNTIKRFMSEGSEQQTDDILMIGTVLG